MGDAACTRAVMKQVISWAEASKPTGALHECANLAAPGTGSGTLSEWMRLSNNSIIHHDHSLSIGRLQQTRNVKCFIITLRDPIARIESGARYNWMHKRARPFDEFVAAAYQHLEHPGADGNATRLAYEYIFNDQDKKHPLYSFNMPYKRYLQPTRDDNVNIYILCTETLTTDAYKLWSLFHESLPREVRVNQRNTISSGTSLTNRTTLPNTTLHSLFLERWLRSTSKIMEDNLMHRMFCLGRR